MCHVVRGCVCGTLQFDDHSACRCRDPSALSHLTPKSFQGIPVEVIYASMSPCEKDTLLQVISRTGVGSTKTRRQSAFAVFSYEESRTRGNVQQATSSSSSTRTYASPEERTARFVSTGAGAAITHMADQLCGEDLLGPTLPEAKYRTADTVPTGLTPPAVASEVAELLAQAPYALKPISAATVAATATMHAGVRVPACLVLTQDAAAEHTREQELHEASPRVPLRFQGGSTCAKVAEFPENIADNSVEDRDTLHGLDSAGMAYGHHALPNIDDQCDTILRKRVPRRSSEDWASTLPQVLSSAAENAEEDLPAGSTLPANSVLAHTPMMVALSTAATATIAALTTTTPTGNHNTVHLISIRTEVAESARETKLPGASPQLSLRFQDAVPEVTEKDEQGATSMRGPTPSWRVCPPFVTPQVTSVSHHDDDDDYDNDDFDGNNNNNRYADMHIDHTLPMEANREHDDEDLRTLLGSHAAGGSHDRYALQHIVDQDAKARHAVQWATREQEQTEASPQPPLH
jgi:hypothetical protein